VSLPDGLVVEGVVLADQVKSLDWRSRRATRISSVPSSVLDQVVARVIAMIAVV
jgi:mRNA interferase MazF